MTNIKKKKVSKAVTGTINPHSILNKQVERFAKENSLSFNPLTDDTSIAESLIEVEQFDVLKGFAKERFLIGRIAKYQALAISFLWLAAATHHETYLDEVFAPFNGCNVSDKFINTIKLLFDLDVQTQAPTITKYSYVLKFLNKERPNILVTTDIEDNVNQLVKLISDKTLEGCVIEMRGESGTSKARTQKEVEALKEAYLDNTASMASITPLTDFEINEDGLSVFIVRDSNNQLEVVDVFADDALVGRILKTFPKK